ncbi:putative two-component response regulator ARR13 [Eucalyptus grandis]|uniref:putative two-component response regulator ARR13 n=1 Tax=Eucalyptus grandis TaxID=71139 RepID=UPI0005258102|nr:putative two-component response regulator ARR13 [Eucalyptus grandis]
MNFSILLVDDCSATLAIVTAILRGWNYQVVTSKHPLHALSILQARKCSFDLVMTDYHMPDMNGLELQRHVREEFKLPVIIMSGDDRQTIILESLEGGAAFYIVKPLRPDDLKNVWQYCIARKKGKAVLIEEEAASDSTSAPVCERIIHEDVNIPVQPLNLEKEGSSQEPNGKKRSREEKDENDEGIDYSLIPPRKTKVVWTTGLHDLFLHAINYIGLDKAVPKRILEFMNVPGLTRENIASHLQKYRIFLKKVAVVDNVAPPRARDPHREAPSSSPTLHPHSSARNDVQQQMPPNSFPNRHPQPLLPEIRPRVSTQVLNDHNYSAAPVRFSPQDASGVGLSIFTYPVIGSSSVYNNPYQTNASSLQVIRPNTGGLSIPNDPMFANSSVNNNPYRTYASNVQAILPNTGGPRNSQIPSLGPTNVTSDLTNPRQVHPPQNHSSSSGTFMPCLSNIAHYPSVNSNPTNTNFWGTQMTGGAGNMLDSNKGFISPIGYDNFVNSSSNFREGSSTGPYIVQEEQEPPFGFNISEPLPPLGFPAANESESPLFSPAPITQPTVAMIEPRNAYEQDVMANAPLVVNSLDQQNHGDGDLFDLVFNQLANKGQEGLPHQGVISSSPGTDMNGPSNELEMFEISDLDHQLEDFAFWFEQGSGQDIQLDGHSNEAPENRLPLPSNESSNLQQGNNENRAIPLLEPTTSTNDLFADEESYPNIWDEDFVDALLTGSPFL